MGAASVSSLEHAVLQQVSQSSGSYNFSNPLPHYFLSIRYRDLLVVVSLGVSAFGGLVDKMSSTGLDI